MARHASAPETPPAIGPALEEYVSKSGTGIGVGALDVDDVVEMDVVVLEMKVPEDSGGNSVEHWS
jgi:hypothetical protein